MSKKSIKYNQKGLVSVSVTLIIMIIVTLVVSSFALIVRREQRRTLDRQLSTQAFSAAEAGIRDAQAALSDSSDPLTEDVTDCTGSGSFKDKMDVELPGNNYNNIVAENIEYSCVLIERNTVDYDNTTANVEDGAFAVPIKTDTPGIPINSLRISWQGQDNSTTFTGGYSLPNGSVGGLDSPMLRLTIIPDVASKTRSDLRAQTHTMFLTPKDNISQGQAGTINYINKGSIEDQSKDELQGAFVSGECNAGNVEGATVGGRDGKYFCNVDINNLNAEKYYVVIQPLYRDAKVNIQVYKNGTDEIVMSNQAQIDATGKAGDVLRRVRVRVDTGETANLNYSASDKLGIIDGAAITTTESICKKISWHPAFGATPAKLDNNPCS